MSGKEKRPLVPRLRFPEFREAAEWGKDKLEELITTVSPPSKLHSSSYRPQGKFPIIDQSQELRVCLLIHFGGFPFRRQTFFALFEPLPFSQPGVLTKRRSKPGSQRQQTSKLFWRIRLRRFALP